MAHSLSKQKTLDSAHKHLIPGRIDTFGSFGIDLVIGQREGYRIRDVDGHELMDLHLNGGTFNLGHRHPGICETLKDSIDKFDIGNHHFASKVRTELAEKLIKFSPDNLQYVVFTAGGSEANDVAIKSARRATGRRKIVALDAAYHGRTGLSGVVGQDDNAKFFLSDDPQLYIKVPFNDIKAMEYALSSEDVAAVIMETIPATYGFPLPEPDYLPKVKALCEKYGSLYIADEVQTGMGRTGKLWAIEHWNIKPDILVTGKGLSGGMYPMAAALLSKRVGQWLSEDGWGHVSTFGGAEVGCAVASTTLDICSDPIVLQQASVTSEYLVSRLTELQQSYSFITEIRHCGLVMGIKFNHPEGGVKMMKALFDQGVWAIFAGFDKSVLQFKPGLLVDQEYCDELISRFEKALQSL